MKIDGLSIPQIRLGLIITVMTIALGLGTDPRRRNDAN